MEEVEQSYQELGGILTTIESKIIYLAIVVVAAAIVTFIVSRFIKRIWKRTDKGALPSASIFLNIARAIIWVLALILVLDPVFGVDPAGFIAALGITGVALSFGLQDTIANLLGGLQLIFGGVIKPGDHVKIGSITGTVRDVNWRQTTIISRVGEVVEVPNSVLNTTALQLLPDSLEGGVTVPIHLKHNIDVDAVAHDVAQTLIHEMGNDLVESEPPSLLYQRITPQAIEAGVWIVVKPGRTLANATSKAIKALANKPYMAEFDSIKALDDLHSPTE